MEFMNGAINPIGAIVLCILFAYAVVVWADKSIK